jgi:hypothetical protein
MAIKSTIFRDVTPFSGSISTFKRNKLASFSWSRSRRNIKSLLLGFCVIVCFFRLFLSTLKKELLQNFSKLLSDYRHHIPEDNSFYNDIRENLRYRKFPMAHLNILSWILFRETEEKQEK